MFASVLFGLHDDVIKWKHFLRYWPFVRWIHRWHKGQRHGALMFHLICAWTNNWTNNGDAGDLRRHHAHYDVTVMKFRPTLPIPFSVSWTVSILCHRYWRWRNPKGHRQLHHINSLWMIYPPKHRSHYSRVHIPWGAPALRAPGWQNSVPLWRHMSWHGKGWCITGTLWREVTIHRWCKTLMFLMYAWTACWTSRLDAGDLIRHGNRHCIVACLLFFI